MSKSIRGEIEGVEKQHQSCPHVKPYLSLMSEEKKIVDKVMEATDGCKTAGGGVCSNRQKGRVCIQPHGVVKRGEWGVGGLWGVGVLGRS